FLKLAADHSITVFLVIAPLEARLEQLRDQRGLTASYEAFARGLQAHHPNLVVVDGVHTGYPPSVFSDAIHVTRPGAVARPNGLADVMQPYLEGKPPGTDRWAALPRFTERAATTSAVASAQSSRSSVPWKTVR